jgi:BioD-like phosphotransacetylase family protein
MCKKIFVAATGQHCGKTTTSLSLMYCALKKYKRVGFIKPVGPKLTTYQGRYMDMDAALMAEVYGLDEDLDYMSPVTVHKETTRDVLDGKITYKSMEEKILSAMEVMEKKCDFLIIEGAGHSGVGSVIGMSNARVAKIVDAPVLIISGGGVGNVIDAVHMNLALYKNEGADVRLVLANKLLAEKRENTLKYLQLAFKNENFEVLGGLNYSPILANPTLNHISKLLNLPINGNQDDTNRIVHAIQLGAASSQRVVDLLKTSSLVLVTSSRDELIVTLSSLYHDVPEYREKIAGLVISGISPISKISQQILDNCHIPYLRTTETTKKTFLTLTEDVSKIAAMDKEKISLIQTTVEKTKIFNKIDPLF